MLETPVRLHIREITRREVIRRAERISGKLSEAREMAICFVDFAGFTALTQNMTDTEIKHVARRLEDLVYEMVESPVRLIKLVGDGAMLVSPNASSLTDTAASMVVAAESDQSVPRLRAGIAFGDVLSRGGDCYGYPVNLASRVTGIAEAGTVLATTPVVEADRGGHRWRPIAPVRLKGVHAEVSLSRLG
jgi:adenylate cyclase